MLLLLLETVLLALAGNVGNALQGSATTTATAGGEALPALDKVLISGSVRRMPARERGAVFDNISEGPLDTSLVDGLFVSSGGRDCWIVLSARR